MTDTVAVAKQAREKLAAALSILQSPSAGALIDSVAEPVARAMGALHGIESSGGTEVPTKAPVALDAVRAALAALQTAEANSTAEQAMEHIAGSLGLVHGLAEAAKRPVAVPAQPAAVQPAAIPPELERTQLASNAARVSGGPAPAAPSGGFDQTIPKAPEAPVPRYAGLDATQTSPGEERSGQPAAPSRAPRERRSSKHASSPPEAMPTGATQAEANLGAHSPTNFYKGLSGNDVVDDGGLFIATYEIPPIGTKLWLTVNMPGGYDFQALAEVRWTRESGVGDAPPGYGCTFQSLSQGARTLIYRYVRNREPLFHDDL